MKKSHDRVDLHQGVVAGGLAFSFPSIEPAPDGAVRLTDFTGKVEMMTSVDRHSLKRSASRAAGVLVLVTASIAQPMLSRPAAAQTAPAASAAPVPQEFADAVEIRIAELHHTLKITPAQEALFRAYADAMRGNAQAIGALFMQRAQAADFTAPARLHWYAQLTAAHAAAVNRLIAPFDALYQSLSDSQKAAADRHFETLQQRRLAQHAR